MSLSKNDDGEISSELKVREKRKKCLIDEEDDEMEEQRKQSESNPEKVVQPLTEEHKESIEYFKKKFLVAPVIYHKVTHNAKQLELMNKIKQQEYESNRI